MTHEEITLLSYQDILDKIRDQNSHLLLGNGFNTGLGVSTSYKDIFNKMIEDYRSVYADAESMMQECGYDLEAFIGKLAGNVSDNDFLKKYIANKVKYDFMKATHEIVKKGIRNVYSKKNEGVYILLNNFDNFFTLNFDSFLYLLLLKYKGPEKDATIAFQQPFDFIEEDVNETFDNTIYTEIKNARNTGSVDIKVASETISKSMSSLTKTHFKKEIITFAKEDNKDWDEKDIRTVVDRIMEEEKNKKVLEVVDDGMKRQMRIDGLDNEIGYVYDIETETQNLFFLHGAFHIFRDGEEIKKITQTDNEALYERLENILNDGDKEILCVFQSENKLEEINKNAYLSKALNKLGTLTGNLVIIGVSFGDNDQHIFDNIALSKIDNIYIATSKNKYKALYREAKEKFGNKNIFLFDRETITYESPNEQK